MPYANPEQQRNYQRDRVARHRAEWLADKSCVVCGSTEDLQIDHIDPSKKVSHRIWSWSAARREAELAKCQVLCWPHHKEKTFRDHHPDGVRHGTAGAFKNAGCRCEICRAYKAQAWQAYKMRRPKPGQERGVA